MRKGEHYTVAKQIANGYPVVEGTRCISVHIPDDISFVAVLAAAVSRLGNTWSSLGTVEERQAWSLMWQTAYAATDWSGCMTCEDVQDCIETNEGVQDAIEDIVAGGSEFPAHYPYGEKLPLARLNQDLVAGTNPTCNLDILWAQCLGAITATGTAILQTLAKIETATNAVELAQAGLGTIPIVAGVEKTFGIDGAMSLLNYFQESVQEGFAAQYTTTPGGVQDEIACALFCECKEDCIITISRIELVMSTRLAVYISVPSLEGLVNLIEFLAGVNVDTTIVVDLAFFAAVQALKLGNYLFGNVGNNILDLVIRLKADEPSNDWEILCPCSDVCRLTLDYANQPPDLVFTSGTLDPAGFVESEVFGGDTEWIIFSCEQPVVGMERIRLVYDTNTVQGTQVYGDTFFFATSDNPTRINLIEFAITIETGGVTGNITDINTRQPIGNIVPFQLLRIEVVYAC